MTMREQNDDAARRKARRSERLRRDAAAQLAERTTTLYQRALSARRSPTSTERRMWAAIVRAKLETVFVRQRVYRDYYVDLCVPRRLIVEIDGESHDRQREYDARRDAYFIGLGYAVRRFTNAEVWRSADRIVADLASEFGLVPSAPPPKPKKRRPRTGPSAATAWLDER